MEKFKRQGKDEWRLIVAADWQQDNEQSVLLFSEVQHLPF